MGPGWCLLDKVEVVPHRIFTESDYLIINPLQVESAEWEDLSTRALAPGSLSHHSHLLPRLASIRELSPERRIGLLERDEKSVRDGSGSLWCCALKSQALAEQMISHLSRQFVVRTPHGSKYLLRYHDPSVFRHLVRILNQGQLAGLMGPVSVWSWRDASRGIWYEVRCPKGSPQQLENEQWGAIHRIGLVNSVLRDVERAGLGCSDDPELVRSVDFAIQQAIEKWKLIDVDDQCRWALHSIAYGADWMLGEAAAALMDRVKRGEGSYCALFEDVLPLMVERASINKLEGTRNARI